MEAGAAMIGHNGYVDPAEWAWQAAQSKAHSLVKLVVHTLRCLIRDGEQEADVSDERLAELTSLTVKSVRKYRKQAHDEGWVNHRPGSGRGHNSTYQMVIPSRTLSQLASLIDIDKSRNEKGTFNKTTNAKATLERVPLEGKVPTESSPLGEKWEPERDFSATDPQKEIPPTPPKEKIYNTTPTPQKPSGVVVEEISGLNGATHLFIEKLAGWINPMMPDRLTARASLQNLVQIYPPDIIRDSFAHVEAKVLSGEIVPAPIKYLTGTCRGMHAENTRENARADKGKPRQKTRQESADDAWFDREWREFQKTQQGKPA